MMINKTSKIVVILHDIRSNANVGSIFRTADTAGVDMIYLTGYTPSPLDRFGRPVKEIAKIALGAEKTVKWKKVKNISKVIAELKKEKFKIVAVEQSGNSVDYKKVKKSAHTAFVFGNEVKGVSPKVLSLVDVVAEIPMKGKKESLNVSVSAGIALFRILNI